MLIIMIIKRTKQQHKWMKKKTNKRRSKIELISAEREREKKE